MKKTILAIAVFSTFTCSAMATEVIFDGNTTSNNIVEDTVVTKQNGLEENNSHAFMTATSGLDLNVAEGKSLTIDWSAGGRISGVLTNNGGKFTNNGAMTVIGTETDFWKIKAINVWGGEAINEGTIKANNAYATQISSEGGKLINKGTIVVEGIGTGIDAANNNDNTVIENYGSIIALGEFTTAAFISKGTFTNSGTIVADGIAIQIQPQYESGSNVELILVGQSQIIGDVDLTDTSSLIVTEDAIAQNISLVDNVGKVTNNSNLTITQAREDALNIGSLTTTEGATTNFKLSHVGSIENKVLTIGNVEGTGEVSVGYTGNISDALTKGEVASENLLAGISIGQSAPESVTVDQGIYGDAYTITADGMTVASTNSLLTSAQDLAMANAYMWRSELSSLSDRMGTLRTVPEKAGAWARYTNGRFDGDDLTHDFNTLEIGADMRITDTFMLGMSFNYTMGETELVAGDSDNDSYSVGFYGSYFNDNGCFLDAMLKIGRIDSDYSFHNGINEKGDYELTGAIFGIETGHRWTINNWFVEPQVQLTYSYLKSEDYDTNLRNVEFDSMESLIARVGVLGGVSFAQNKGSAYAKVSYNHDFMGEVEGNFTTDGYTRTFKDELDDNWGEAAIGASYQVSNQLNTFVDVSTGFGGDIDQEWRFNVGARYAF